jgi:hypothetical protein
MSELIFTESADAELKRLESSPSEEGKTKQIKKALGYLQSNLKHPSLQTHKFDAFPNPYDSEKDVFVAYAQQHTPGAARILWCYGPEKQQITILAIIAHP